MYPILGLFSFANAFTESFSNEKLRQSQYKQQQDAMIKRTILNGSPSIDLFSNINTKSKSKCSYCNSIDSFQNNHCRNCGAPKLN